MCYNFYNTFFELRSQDLSVILFATWPVLTFPVHFSKGSVVVQVQAFSTDVRLWQDKDFICPSTYQSFRSGVSVLACKCYKPVGSVFEVFCLCWPSSYRFAGSQTHIWVSGGNLKPSKRFAFLRQNTLFLFYSSSNIAKTAHNTRKHYCNWTITERCMSGSVCLLVIAVMDTRLQFLSGRYFLSDVSCYIKRLI